MFIKAKSCYTVAFDKQEGSFWLPRLYQLSLPLFNSDTIYITHSSIVKLDASIHNFIL